MKRTLWVLPLFFCVLFVACPAYCSIYYVDPNGNDSNSGDINHPFQTIPHAVSTVVAGDTIYLRGGRHYYSAKISISKVGTSGARYNMIAYPGDSNRPILDFSAMAYNGSNRGISLSGQYWYIKGLDIYKAGDNGMNISGSNNIIEFCSFYENCDSGLQLGGGASNNQIINCDSYYNYDYNTTPTPGSNADGFSPKLDVGTGNYFYGCRSWQNSDDAYDCYLTTSNEVNTTFENCWAFKAGYLKDGSVATNGNGNGFKMGSSTNNHNVTLKNCLAFTNKAKGFDQNHNKGSMKLYNCTAYNNGDKNYSIYETLAVGKDANLTNCVHYTGTNNLGTFVVLTTVSWKPPFAVNSADFVSLDPAAAYGARKADGNLPDITFMHLAAGSDLIDGGTNVGLPFYGSGPDLGCFEYVPAGSPPGQASGPVPSNVATDVGLTQDLSWTAGSGATSHDVYFGTNNPPPSIGNQAGTTYDTGTMVSLTAYYWRIDEKNAYGTTTGAVWSFTTQDADTPLPNPMEWAILPAAAGTGSISMSAATAIDISGVEYYFTNVSDSNHDSGWQDSNVYTDTGLTRSTAYTYMVKARDKSINHNETGWSDTADAMTLRYDCTSQILSDLNSDCQVDLFDFARFADAWANDLPEADLHNDGFLDLLDIAQFASDWLSCNRDPDTECWQ